METVIARKQVNHGMTRIDMEEYFDDAEVENLYHWIDRIPLSRPKRDIGKDFSDAVLLAEVINHYFPKMINMHNYSPVNATRQKMENWYLLNSGRTQVQRLQHVIDMFIGGENWITLAETRKYLSDFSTCEAAGFEPGRVLKRFDLDLSDDVIHALANAKPRVIEKVLLLLRLQIDKMLERRVSSTGDYLLVRNSPHQSPRRSINKEIPHSHSIKSSYFSERRSPYHSFGTFLQPLMDNVPRVLLEEKEGECLGKEETIRIMHAKVKRLEHLLELKQTRIQDIEDQIAQGQTSALKIANKRWQ